MNVSVCRPYVREYKLVNQRPATKKDFIAAICRNKVWFDSGDESVCAERIKL